MVYPDISEPARVEEFGAETEGSTVILKKKKKANIFVLSRVWHTPTPKVYGTQLCVYPIERIKGFGDNGWTIW